jgi:hypothetical protein
MMVGIRFTEVLQERLQTEPIHTGQVEAEAIPVGWIERRVEVGPLAGAPHDLRRAKPCGQYRFMCQLINQKGPSSKDKTLSLK